MGDLGLDCGDLRIGTVAICTTCHITGGGDGLRVFEKYRQLRHRQAPAFIRHVLAAFGQGILTAAQATEQLELSRSRLYTLATACARVQWTPGTLGGNHVKAWPQPVVELLCKRLGRVPPCQYSFAASEALRPTASSSIAPKCAGGCSPTS